MATKLNFVGTNFNGGRTRRAAMMPSSIEEAFCIVVDKGRRMNDVGKVARLCDPSTYQGQFSLGIVAKLLLRMGWAFNFIHSMSVLTICANEFYIKFQISY